MISVVCTCGAKMQAKDEKAGSSFDCPKCGQRLTVPQPAETIDELPVLKRRTSLPSCQRIRTPQALPQICTRLAA